ncbi:MAG: zinc-ribbon domain-containing protein [Firmicutes bacterium]|nr:zinc-ribbon domain-containing protein [Bacillota bacterium]
MARFCTKCGKPLGDGALFCNNCGTRIANVAGQTGPAQAPNQSVPPQGQYGYRPQMPPYNMPPQLPKKKKTGLIIGIVVGLILVVLFFVGAFAWPGFLKDDSEAKEDSFFTHHEARERDDEDDEEEEEVSKQTNEAESSQDENITHIEFEIDGGGFPSDSEIPDAVVNPALIGTWGFHDAQTDVDITYTFNADGTGNYYGNGMDVPIVSYVATDEPFTEYPEDGNLLVVYFGEMVVETEEGTTSISLGAVEYGYVIDGNVLRIIYSRDIANHYTDFTRE